MRTITIKQPWAAWIADGHKTVELRTWRTDYRGRLLITASANPAKCRVELDDGTTRILPAGCLVCVVDLVDCRPATAADSDAACCDVVDNGLFAWVLANPRPVQPEPVKGRLNLWQYTGPVNHLPLGVDWLDAPSHPS
jgi:hypothetical protein